jgi:hypothetical protein
MDDLAEANLEPSLRLFAWVTAVVEARLHGHTREAERLAQELEGQVDTRSVPLLERVRAGVALKQWERTEAAVDSLVAVDPESLEVLGMLGIVRAHLGAREEALRISRQIEAVQGPYDNGRSPYWLGCIAAALGEHGQAVRLLEEAFEDGYSFSRRENPSGFGVHADPNLDPLRGFGPFERLVKPKG